MESVDELTQVFVDMASMLTESEFGQIVVLYFKNWWAYWDFVLRAPFMTLHDWVTLLWG
jgi:hypothetical protein